MKLKGEEGVSREVKLHDCVFRYLKVAENRRWV